MNNHEIPQASADQLAKMEEKLKLEKQLKSGADWFFWIAGLSIINSIVILFDGDWIFFIGLGITQLIQGLAIGLSRELGSNSTDVILIGAFLISLLTSGIFIIFGYYARNLSKLGFIIGMVLYALDGLIFLIFGDFLSLAFHVIALVALFNGYRAIDKFKATESVNIEHF